MDDKNLCLKDNSQVVSEVFLLMCCETRCMEIGVGCMLLEAEILPFHLKFLSCPNCQPLVSVKSQSYTLKWLFASLNLLF